MPRSVFIGDKEYTPFWDPEPAELQCCAELFEWWKAIEEERKRRQGPVTQISGTSKRKHRLICDADPEMEPMGFFDCTVEVRFVPIAFEVHT